MFLKRGEVFIFKAQADDDDDTSYSKPLEEAGLVPKTISVLDFDFCNLDCLKEHLQRPQDYSGIIFTSPRSVKAVLESIKSVENLPVEWNNHPMFVVGNTTKMHLKNDLGLQGECGSTENATGLAEIIVQRSYSHPLLFPCSSIRKDTLPSLLTEKGVPFLEIKAYDTRQHAQLEDSLRNATAQGTVFPEFMVFFSPSGVKFSLPVLSQLNVPLPDIKVVAIGSVTAAALKEANVEVWSYSAKPTPQYLLHAFSGEA